MNENNIIREFDFFRNFEKPVDAKQLKNEKIISNYVAPTCFLIGFSMVISIGVSLYSTQNEIHEIMYVENQKIATKINQFVIENQTNKFVVQKHNECSKLMHGTAENISNKCDIYVITLAQRAPTELNVDIRSVPQSLEQFKKLSQYSPKSVQKLNQLFSQLGIKVKENNYE